MATLRSRDDRERREQVAILASEIGSLKRERYDLQQCVTHGHKVESIIADLCCRIAELEQDLQQRIAELDAIEPK